MQVRHHRGALHTLPYGQIERLTNHSRDWTVMKLEFRLTYETDLVLVKKILKRIGEELKQDPELGPHLIMPLKSQGVRATEDSAVVVRAKFVSEPGDWPYLIQREAYNRVLKAFRERGVTFAHQQVTVFAAPGGEAGPVAAPRPARAAAAVLAAEQPAEGAPEPPPRCQRADGGPVPLRRGRPVPRPRPAPLAGGLRACRPGVRAIAARAASRLVPVLVGLGAVAWAGTLAPSVMGGCPSAICSSPTAC